MFGFLDTFAAQFKAYIYGIIATAFIGMSLTIYLMNVKIDNLNKELAVKNTSLDKSKDLIAKMTGSTKINESVNGYIDNGVSILLTEHKSIEDQLREEYTTYLMENREEEMCKEYCSANAIEQSCDSSNPIPNNNTYITKKKNKEDEIKKKMIEAAWKNYCINNRLADGCK